MYRLYRYLFKKTLQGLTHKNLYDRLLALLRIGKHLCIPRPTESSNADAIPGSWIRCQIERGSRMTPLEGSCWQRAFVPSQRMVSSQATTQEIIHLQVIMKHSGTCLTERDMSFKCLLFSGREATRMNNC